MRMGTIRYWKYKYKRQNKLSFMTKFYIKKSGLILKLLKLNLYNFNFNSLNKK